MLPKYPRVMMAAVVVVWSGPIYSPQLKGSLDPDTSAATNQFEPRVSEEQIPELIAAITRAEASVINNRDNAAEQSLWKTYADLNHRTIPQVLELVRQKPKTEEAFTGLKWIVTNRQVTAGDPRLLEFGKSAMELLLSHHSMHPQIAEVFHAAAGEWITGHQPTSTLLRMVADKHPDSTTRAQATFALSLLKKHNADWLEAAEQEAKRTKRDPSFYDTYQSLRSMGDLKTQKAEAITLLEAVIKDYATFAPLPRDSIRKIRATLGEEAQAELFELTRLEVGCVAPEIDGVSAGKRPASKRL